MRRSTRRPVYRAIVAVTAALALTACAQTTPDDGPTTPPPGPTATPDLTDVLVGGVSVKDVMETVKLEVGGDFAIGFVREADARQCDGGLFKGSTMRPAYCTTENTVFVPERMQVDRKSLSPVAVWYVSAKAGALSARLLQLPATQACAAGFIAAKRMPGFGDDEVQALQGFITSGPDTTKDLTPAQEWQHAKRGIEAVTIEKQHQVDLPCRL